ncbi:MAG TPA: hypothetical protein VGN55_15685 [Xanthobacteraceae bacterium]|jgi:hypothetical protein
MRILLHHLAGGRGMPAVVLAALLCGMPMPVQAEVSIAGGPADIRLEASDASLEEILLALHASFKLRYHTLATLDDAVSGSYHGPLARVASQLLDRYDFMMKVAAESVEISVFRRHAPAEAPNPTSAARQRPTVLPVPAAMTALEASQTERR